ncbi:hypothetical protein ACP70R_025363 [Stipagrostis hirtigluma subsp. patula]
MATIKLAVPVALLLCGLMVIGFGSIQSTEAARQGRVCPMYCLNVTYMTCPPNHDQLQPVCNCCLAPKKGCTIYLGDGEAKMCP